MSTAAPTSHQLFQECQNLVRSLAWQIHRQLPQQRFDIDDLIAYGQVGLAEAARDFDPERMGKFSTFAYYRIRGSIFDGLAKLSGVSRGMCRRMRQEQLSDDVMRVNGEQDPTSQTPQDNVRWFKRLASALGVARMVSSSYDEADEDCVGGIDVADSEPEPASVVMERESAKVLRELIEALPEQAGRLIRATYFEGRTLQDAGNQIGISKAWASRLHAKTLERLASALKQRDMND